MGSGAGGERALPPVEQRGRVHRVDPRRIRQRRRVDRQPRGVEPLQLRDPRCARARGSADRRGASLEHRRSGGLAARQRDRGRRLAPRDRQGPGRIPRGTGVSRRSRGRSLSARLAALTERLEVPLLVTDLTNIRYLTGFDSSNAALVVEPAGGATLYTDFRYIESAREIEGVEPVLAKRALMHDIAARLPKRVQFEADVLPYSQWQALAEGASELVPSSGLVEELRAVKDDEEVAKLQRASRIADRGLEALTADTWVGRTEREIAWRLRELLHAHGADEQSFDTIVASGPNGALPHAHPTDRIVEKGELVTLDWGVGVDGYYSDCTRTFSTGGISDKLREIYDITLEAQQRAMANIKAGMTGVEADALARDVITDAGYGENFGHGLGHGVGMAVHEAPRLSTESTDVLEDGHAVTVEPGIYVPGLGGVRIEDLAIVRDDGLQVLTSFPKELIDVG